MPREAEVRPYNALEREAAAIRKNFLLCLFLVAALFAVACLNGCTRPEVQRTAAALDESVRLHLVACEPSRAYLDRARAAAKRAGKDEDRAEDEARLAWDRQAGALRRTAETLKRVAR